MSLHCSPQLGRPRPLLASLRLGPSRAPSRDAQSVLFLGHRGMWGPCPSSPPSMGPPTW